MTKKQLVPFCLCAQKIQLQIKIQIQRKIQIYMKIQLQIQTSTEMNRSKQRSWHTVPIRHLPSVNITFQHNCVTILGNTVSCTWRKQSSNFNMFWDVLVFCPLRYFPLLVDDSWNLCPKLRKFGQVSFPPPYFKM